VRAIISIKTTMEELTTYMRGWRGYFGFCQTPKEPPMENTTASQGGTGRAGSLAGVAQMAGSGRGPWHLARSKALSVGLSSAYFRSLGLPSLIEAR
jgi:RNA-directed DNA polymerase